MRRLKERRVSQIFLGPTLPSLRRVSLSLDNNDGAEDDDDDVDNNGHFTHKLKHTTTHTHTDLHRASCLQAIS